MNLNEEDFNTSDAWLSEQLFAQLKEYKDKNAPSDLLLNETFQNCSNNMPLLDDDIPWQDLKPASLDTFETALKVDTFSNNYNINEEVLDLSRSNLKEHQLKSPQPEENIFDLVENIPLLAAPEVTNVAENDEELKLLNFLESQTNGDIKRMLLKNKGIFPLIFFIAATESSETSPQILPFVTTYKINKSVNCNYLLNFCDSHSQKGESDKDQNILPHIITKHSTIKSVKADNTLPSEPACIRLLRENQIRIRRFLKDELKYDVNNNLIATNPTNTSTSSGVSSSVNMSISSNKKQDGPHECTLCERKFVHASGLLRHMEKHALDLIPTTNTMSNNKTTSLHGVQGISGLRVVIKCTLCGRIFFGSNDALKHLFSHFPDSTAEENEMDNCADIPYEAYVDDAFLNLKSEVFFQIYFSQNL